MKSINRKLMILFFVVGVSALSVVGTYSYYNAKSAILKRTLDQLTSIRVIKKSQIEFFFNERIKNITLLSENENLKKTVNSIASEPNVNKNSILNLNLWGYKDVYLIVESLNGNLFFYSFHGDSASLFSPDSLTYSQLTELWRKTIVRNKPSIVDFKKYSKEDVDPVCFVGKKIEQVDFRALLALQIPVSDINAIMFEENPENGLGKSGEIYLVGEDYLMRSKSRFIPNSVLNTEVKTHSVINAFKNKYGSSLIDDYRTVACLSTYDQLSIPDLKWAILAEIDYEEAMIPIVSIRNDIVFLSLIICVFLFSLSHFISRNITNPIIRLKNAALKIGEGSLDINVRPTSSDEIGLLTDAFNTMALQLKDERLQRMSALYDGQEMERQRISRELHDGLGQKLVAIKLQMESTSKLKPEEVNNRIKEVRENFTVIIDEVRQISNNLAPNILNESGIDIALQSLCNSLLKTTDIEIELSVYGDYYTPDTKVKFYIYRIAQEGINNAIKHSGASRIQLQLIGNKDNILLVIEDNGKGFKYTSNYCTPCNGIYNMRERARLLDGTLDIETEPEAGTTIRLKVPKSKN